MVLDVEPFSDVESVGESSSANEPYPFEQYDLQCADYFKGLAILHMNHMYLYDCCQKNTYSNNVISMEMRFT